MLGPQFHEDSAETWCKATSSGGRATKSARLSPIGPEVFEFECGSGPSLRPLPRRRCRLADDETPPEMHEIAESYEIAEDETLPEKHEIAPEITSPTSTKIPWVFLDARMELLDSDDPMLDETLSKTSEDETSPEIHEIAGSGFGESAAQTLPTE